MTTLNTLSLKLLKNERKMRAFIFGRFKLRYPRFPGPMLGMSVIAATTAEFEWAIKMNQK